MLTPSFDDHFQMNERLDIYFQLLVTQQHNKQNSTFHLSCDAMLWKNQVKFQILQNDKSDHILIFDKTVITLIKISNLC